MRNAGWGGPTINLLRMVLLCALDNAVVCQMSPGLLLESWIESSCACDIKKKKEKKKRHDFFSPPIPSPSPWLSTESVENRFHRVIPGIKKGNNVVLNCIQQNWFELGGGRGGREVVLTNFNFHGILSRRKVVLPLFFSFFLI